VTSRFHAVGLGVPDPLRVRGRLRRLGRYRRIATVLARHGFHDFVANNERLRSWGLHRRLLGDLPEDVPETRWQRVRHALEELGPAFIKLGQFLSNRPDLIPAALSRELEHLLDNVPPTSFAEVAETVRRELGGEIADLFADFEEIPFSSASIAQVHRARLKSGEPVAVKIQRPGISGIIEADLEIMTQLAGMLAGFMSELRAIDPVRIIAEFREEVAHELDFHRELANIERFRAKVRKDRRVYVPQVHRSHCGRRILTMEYVVGTPLKRIATDPGLDPDKVLANLTGLVFAQIFDAGYFHADPHPANILVLPDNVICFIDFGLMGTLTPGERDLFNELVAATVQGRSRDVARAIVRLCGSGELEQFARFEGEVYRLVDTYAALPLQDVRIDAFFNDVLRIVIGNRLAIPIDIYLLIKAMTTLEGTVRRIRPEFRPMEQLAGLVRQRLIREMGPWSFLQELYRAAGDYGRLAAELPEEVRELLRQFKRRSFRIQFEHRGLEPMLQTHQQISNRISFAIITASMLIGSSLIIHADLAPRFHGIPVIGMGGFLVAMLMSLLLIWSILRHGRL